MKYREIRKKSGMAVMCLVTVITWCGCSRKPPVIEEQTVVGVKASERLAGNVKEAVKEAGAVSVDAAMEIPVTVMETAIAVMETPVVGMEKTETIKEPEVMEVPEVIKEPEVTEEPEVIKEPEVMEESEALRPQYIYQLIYDANGGNLAIYHRKCKSAVSNAEIYRFSISPVRPASNDALVDFRGWSMDKNAVKGAYRPGDEILLSAENAVKDGDTYIVTVRLYAIWDNINIKPVEGSVIK